MKKRLNWKVWGEKMEMLITKVCPCVDMYMPMYAINLPERKIEKNTFFLSLINVVSLNYILSMQVAIVIAVWGYGKVL